MKRYCAILAMALVVLQAMLVLGSWIVAAIDASNTVRSIISAGGIRWYVGTLTSNVSSPLLAYIVLGSLAYSIFVNSGLAKMFCGGAKPTLQQKFAIRLMAVEFVLFVVALSLATMLPHAILLSVTGDLFPSSFSRGFVPLVFFQVFVLSLIYGVFGGNINTLEKLWDSITVGSSFLSAVCFIYILAAQLFSCFCYVVCWG